MCDNIIGGSTVDRAIYEDGCLYRAERFDASRSVRCLAKCALAYRRKFPLAEFTGFTRIF